MRLFRVFMSASALGLAAIACSSADPSAAGGGSSSSSSGSGGAAPIVIGDRSASVHVPAGYDPSKPAPLVVTLHGYSVNGFLEEIYLDLTPLSDEYGFLYVHPDGTVDKKGNVFWNATDACCNYDGSTVDDSSYLSQLITAISASYSVDPRRVYLVGHSNGGFMAYRMACEHADQIAAVVSLAGAMTEDPSTCKPSAPVAVLQAHGTKDNEVLFDGFAGSATPGNGPYPSATITAKDWATIDGCAATPTAGAPLDVDGNIAGAETTVDRYDGCKSGASVELWAIQGGSHIPDIGSTFRHGIIDFLMAHPKQ
jgi:polyhydroxybutyrate depolymerase